MQWKLFGKGGGGKGKKEREKMDTKFSSSIIK